MTWPTKNLDGRQLLNGLLYSPFGSLSQAARLRLALSVLTESSAPPLNFAFSPGLSQANWKNWVTICPYEEQRLTTHCECLGGQNSKYLINQYPESNSGLQWVTELRTDHWMYTDMSISLSRTQHSTLGCVHRKHTPKTHVFKTESGKSGPEQYWVISARLGWEEGEKGKKVETYTIV